MEAIVTLPDYDLTEAIKASFKKQAVVNNELAILHESIKKVDQAIRKPAVRTSKAAATMLRSLMRAIVKIMADFDIYDEMCQEAAKFAQEAGDMISAEHEENTDGHCDGDIDDISMLDAPVAAHDSPQANSGAEANDSMAIEDVDPAANNSIAKTTTTIDSIINDGTMPPPSPRLAPKPFHRDAKATSNAERHLAALNESYIFLIGNLLHKIRLFDKAMSETLSKGTAATRAEFIRNRWDEVVADLRVAFAEVWVGYGGALGG